MTSWVWNHYTKINQQDALCNLCQKVLKRSGGTKGLTGHLKFIHFMAKPTDTNDNNGSNNGIAQTQNKVAKPRKRKVKKAETSDDDSSVASEIDFSIPGDVSKECESETEFNQNCYVCNFALSPCRYPLGAATKCTLTPVHEYLESFINASLPEEMKSKSKICLECFVIFEKFDELRQQCKSIQNKLVHFFRTSHSEEVFVKHEPEVNFSDDDFTWPEDIPIKRKKNEDFPSFNSAFGSSDSFGANLVKSEKDSKIFYCEECDKDLKSEICLKIHMATDHDRNKNGPFNCPVCLKTKKDRESLRSHLLIHSERKFLCGRCGETFVRKCDLENHLLAHDGIRRFPCTYEGCERRFNTTVKLKAHLRVHTGEKIYECPHCPGKRFAQKQGMDLHIKNHHRNETVAVHREICRVCGIETPTKAKMKAHLVKVHQVVDDEKFPFDED